MADKWTISVVQVDLAPKSPFTANYGDTLPIASIS
jgi:hypothetical protein